MDNKKVAIQTVYLSIFGNILLAAIKAIAGIVGNSYALVADAIESATDVLSSMLVLIGINYSTRPPDKNHPYGHGKAEALSTFAVVGFLIVSATIIVYQSILNIQTPHETPETFTLYVLAGIIVFKEVTYRFVNKKGKEVNSTSLKADAWHHRSDAITSLLAFIGISIALIFGEGFESADDWAALIASGFIVFNAYLIFRPVLGELMDEHLYDELVEKIRTISVNVEGVKGTEKCMVRKLGMYYLVDLHVRVDGNMSVIHSHTIAHKLKDEIRVQLPEVEDVLIHIEPQN
jgi:cation diffusion facilitator family transporter